MLWIKCFFLKKKYCFVLEMVSYFDTNVYFLDKRGFFIWEITRKKNMPFSEIIHLHNPPVPPTILLHSYYTQSDVISMRIFHLYLCMSRRFLKSDSLFLYINYWKVWLVWCYWPPARPHIGLALGTRKERIPFLMERFAIAKPLPVLR